LNSLDILMIHDSFMIHPWQWYCWRTCNRSAPRVTNQHKLKLAVAYLEHHFLELPNIYLSQGIKSVSELNGQRMYVISQLKLWHQQAEGTDWWAGGRKLSGFYDASGNCGSDPDKNEDMPNCRS
jgi:hypothetical protein